jgi:aryl-alcohol dehydrogenase-like predicted oxidoreductase
MEKRRYGKTDIMLSMVGFGGIVVTDETPAAAARVVAHAVQERGINYFDVAPSYGNAEERLGPALEPHRKDVFLACKTEKRSAEDALDSLHNSLKLLRTDYFDLFQLHAVTTPEEVETVLGKGGAMETFVKAREQGKVRFLGFSAHSEEAALALMERFSFDSLLFPFNWVSWNQGKFGARTMAKAVEQKMGILALKTLAKRQWAEGEERKWPKCWYSPVDTYEEAQLAVRFTFSKPVSAAPSPGHAELLWWMCDAADAFTPLTAAEEADLVRRGEGLAPVFPHSE